MRRTMEGGGPARRVGSHEDIQEEEQECGMPCQTNMHEGAEMSNGRASGDKGGIMYMSSMC